ncbi:hypothetical protein J41TS12_00680 [Paenibacillus antibioticophila]|uniref:Uncharacterized protein n=1 Tax=Paenibacillus antibioticophila TaxID=1274374 RepID=A0A919XLI8_9BACL|nr:DUF6470 family protein [Paenibacillus antibioticophila]GIO35207.1 hypothetical protein J41TS12_00680 [Paenibacillus antibioticophila]
MIPQLQIRQQPSLLSIESTNASLSIHQQRPDFSIETRRADLHIEQPRPAMEIDQHEAWRAYTGGHPLEMNQQIYSNLPSLFLQGLAKRVEQGNQLAQFHQPGGSIAEVYGGDWKRDPFVEYRAPASYDNVDIHVQRNNPVIQAQANPPQISAQAYIPDINYHPGRLDVQVKQYASVEIIPPELDVVV